jgi:hypothetical protein
VPQQATPMMTPGATGRRQGVDRWFYIIVALVMILLNVVAFGPSMLNPSERRVPLPLSPLVTVHAIVSVAWLVLGFFSVVEQARRGFDLSGDIGRVPLPPGVTLLAATVALLFFFLEFAILVGAALCYRHRPSVHRRLMLLAVLGGLTPTPVAHVIGHWLSFQPWTLVFFPASFVAFTSLSAIYDRLSQGRIDPVSLWIPILWLGWRVFEVRVIEPSAAWHEFAAWLIR